MCNTRNLTSPSELHVHSIEAARALRRSCIKCTRKSQNNDVAQTQNEKG